MPFFNLKTHLLPMSVGCNSTSLQSPYCNAGLPLKNLLLNPKNVFCGSLADHGSWLETTGVGATYLQFVFMIDSNRQLHFLFLVLIRFRCEPRGCFVPRIYRKEEEAYTSCKFFTVFSQLNLFFLMQVQTTDG